VTGRILSGTGQGPAAVPLEFSGELVFADGVSAGFYCSFTAPLQQWVNVSGTQGWLRMDDFVHPNPPLAPTFQLNGVEVPVPAGAADAGGPRAQDVNMFRHFAEQVRSGRLNADWPQWSLKTQLVQDACLRSARNGGRPEPVGAF
jgi:predicted dehydrogenase